MAIYDPLICRLPSGRKVAAAASALAVSVSKQARPSQLGSPVSRKAHEDEKGATWSLSSPRVQVLALLLLACVANQSCRALPFYLVDFGDPKAGLAMNQDLSFSSADYGFFATVGFTVPFTLASLWAGVAADQVDRFRLTAAAGVGWSICTAGMAAATSYSGLLLLRVLLGLTQAATNPAALSIISELFPDARATANSIFGLGIYLGGAFASLGAYVDEQEGWRTSCVIFGLLSLLAALPALSKNDEKQQARRASWPSEPDADLPTRLASIPQAATSVWETSMQAIEPMGARWLLLASALRFSAGFAILVWLPSAVRTTFPQDVEQFAIINSLIKGLAGSISSIAGGLVADSLRSRGFGNRSAAWLAAASSFASAPLWYFTLDGSSFEVCMGFLLAEYLVAESWLGPAISALQGAVPVDRRGTAQGVFSSLTALGQALPWGLGLLESQDLTRGLQISVAVCYCLSGACFVLASSYLSQDVEAE